MPVTGPTRELKPHVIWRGGLGQYLSLLHKFLKSVPDTVW